MGTKTIITAFNTKLSMTSSVLLQGFLHTDVSPKCSPIVDASVIVFVVLSNLIYCNNCRQDRAPDKLLVSFSSILLDILFNKLFKTVKPGQGQRREESNLADLILELAFLLD